MSEYKIPYDLMLASRSGRIIAIYSRLTKKITVFDCKSRLIISRKAEDAEPQLQGDFASYGTMNLDYFIKRKIEEALDRIETDIKSEEYENAKAKEMTLWDAMMIIQQYTEDAQVKQKQHGLRPMICNLYEGCIEARKNGTITRTIYNQDGENKLEIFDKNGKPLDR